MSFAIEDLENKVCVITGGGGVIGRSLAIGLGNAGVKIAILDIDGTRGAEVAKEIKEITGTETLGTAGNVLDKESLFKAKEEVLQKFGQIDILINGAGGNSPKATTQEEFISNENLDQLDKTFFGLDLQGFRQVFDLNFMGTLLPTMVFSQEMVTRNKGVVLNVSSMNSFRPLTKIPAYSAAKASINNFTEWLSVHFAQTNVRVNGIAPGFFVTNQNRFLLIDEKTQKLTPRGEKIINGTPMRKFGEPEDLIGTVLYLVSDLSAFVTGVTIPVDGGFNAYSGV